MTTTDTLNNDLIRELNLRENLIICENQNIFNELETKVKLICCDLIAKHLVAKDQIISQYIMGKMFHMIVIL